VAQVISFAEVIAARRREQEREHVAACVEIVAASLHHAVQLFAAAPPMERPVRARQMRQLAELLEYLVRQG
jgi:hypothetical protein